MNSLDIEIAVAQHIGHRQHLIVPNVWWGLGFQHELDLAVLTKSGRLWEVEIKVSKSDLKADKKKYCAHMDPQNRISRLYFAVPEKLENCIDLIPKTAGFLVVLERQYKAVYQNDKSGTRIHVEERRKPKIIKSARKLSDAEIQKLYHLGAMRIWNLKKKLQKARQT